MEDKENIKTIVAKVRVSKTGQRTVTVPRDFDAGNDSYVTITKLNL